jgi:predicted RNase H-like HicB family nuclease
MAAQFILTNYVEQALALAVYDKLKDASFTGRIPPCLGVVAFGESLRRCEDELRSTLEDWILLGLKLGHPLPVICGIDLNQMPVRAPVYNLDRLVGIVSLGGDAVVDAARYDE